MILKLFENSLKIIMLLFLDTFPSWSLGTS